MLATHGEAACYHYQFITRFMYHGVRTKYGVGPCICVCVCVFVCVCARARARISITNTYCIYVVVSLLYLQIR